MPYLNDLQGLYIYGLYVLCYMIQFPMVSRILSSVIFLTLNNEQTISTLALTKSIPCYKKAIIAISIYSLISFYCHFIL